MRDHSSRHAKMARAWSLSSGRGVIEAVTGSRPAWRTSMGLQPGTLLIASILAVVLVWAPLGLPWWARLALLVTMPGWLGPIVVRFRQTQPRVAQFMPLAADDPSTPPAIQTVFESTRAALAGRGFVEVARLRQAPSASGLLGYVQLLEDPRTFDVCSRLLVARPGSGMAAADQCAFLTERTARPALATSNMRTASPWPDNPAFDRAVFADVRDPAALLPLHRARLADGPLASVRRTTVASNPAAYQSRIEQVAKDHMVRCGYWWFDDAAQVYRPTWKGAVLMCWRLLPPARQILRSRRAHAAAVLRDRLARARSGVSA
jgi:hypothetical protein